MFSLPYGIIIACDVKTPKELKFLVESTAGIEGIVGYKIGFMLGLLHSLPAAVETVKEMTDLPVVYDYQKAGSDIPQMGEEFAAVMKASNVDSAIIFPQAGPKTEEAFVMALQKEGIIPMVGGEMTHPQFLAKDGGYILDDAPERIYELAAKLGVEHFVVPGNKPDKIRKYLGMLPENSKICMRGIGRQGGEIEAAFNACNGYNAYAIIGSAIYKSPNPADAAKSFSAVVKRFL